MVNIVANPLPTSTTGVEARIYTGTTLIDTVELTQTPASSGRFRGTADLDEGDYDYGLYDGAGNRLGGGIISVDPNGNEITPGLVLEAVRAIPTSEPTGDGDVAVGTDYGGDDNLRAVDSEGDGEDGVTIRAYLEEDFDAHDFDVKAQTSTGSDGRLIAPMMLDAGDYVLVYSKPGRPAAEPKELTVT